MDESSALAALRNGKSLATEVTSDDDQHRSFVGVYPLDLSVTTSREVVFNHGVQIVPEKGVAYRVRRFSVDRKLIARDVWISESNLVRKTSRVVFSEAQLAQVVDEFGSTLDSLDLPANSDYPI